jgi:hypothetical protein
MGIRLEKRTVPEKTETVELFSIDDVAYHIPAVPRLNISLKYLRIARNEGETMAVAYLLEALLGKDGWEALTEYDDLKPEEFQQIVSAAQKIAVATVEPHKS